MKRTAAKSPKQKTTAKRRVKTEATSTTESASSVGVKLPASLIAREKLHARRMAWLLGQLDAVRDDACTCPSSVTKERLDILQERIRIAVAERVMIENAKAHWAAKAAAKAAASDAAASDETTPNRKKKRPSFSIPPETKDGRRRSTSFLSPAPPHPSGPSEPKVIFMPDGSIQLAPLEDMPGLGDAPSWEW